MSVIRFLSRSVLVVFGMAAGLAPMGAQTQFSTLINIVPCRVIDTRNDRGPYGAPYLVGKTSRDVDIPNSACSIPSNAVAYSLNATVIPHGPLQFITVYPSGVQLPNASTLNAFQGQIVANAAIVPAGVNGKVAVYASNDTELILDINGYFVTATIPAPAAPAATVPQSTTNFQSLAIGAGASSAGAQNVAVGTSALNANFSGNLNTALGSVALANNSNGSNNTAVGALSLNNNASGSENSAFGAHSLESNGTGLYNTAVGHYALQANTVG